MKFEICVFLLLTFVTRNQVIADLLDNLDHDNQNHHIDHEFDDHNDHFDDIDHESLDQDHLNFNNGEISENILNELTQFLPNKEPPRIIISANIQPDQQSLFIDVPIEQKEIQDSSAFKSTQQQSNRGIPLPLITLDETVLSNVNQGVTAQTLNVPASNFQEHLSRGSSVTSDTVSNTIHQNQPLTQTSDSSFGILQQSFLPQKDVKKSSLQHSTFPEVNVKKSNLQQSILSKVDIKKGSLPEVDLPSNKLTHISNTANNLENPVFKSSFFADSDQEDFEVLSNNNHVGGEGRQLDSKPHLSISPFEGEFPRYAIVPRTSFSCEDHAYGGYFADTEADCQVFHICLSGSLLGSFLCPNATLFNQQLFVCDWWYNVDCTIAPRSYDLNAMIGVTHNENNFS